eukprot:233104-Pelagomonas_calceolata.AAC.2
MRLSAPLSVCIAQSVFQSLANVSNLLQTPGPGGNTNKKDGGVPPWQQQQQQEQQQQQQLPSPSAAKDRPAAATLGIGTLLGHDGNESNVKQIIGMGVSPPKGRAGLGGV